MSMEIWVAGYPSFYGGADSEVCHQIDLWRQYGVEVNLVPMFGCDPRMKALCDARGCITHTYNPSIFKDKLVASFCNGEFLAALPAMVRPRTVLFFNCMTFIFPQELICHQLGLIDLFAYQSTYQRNMLVPGLSAIGPVHEFPYLPYFNVNNQAQQLSFGTAPLGAFRMGRISRSDPAKFSADMWDLFANVRCVRPKKTFIAGWSPDVERKCGPAPVGLDWQVWPGGHPDITPVSKFYERIHVMIHKTGGSRESYCRVLLEAWASGIVPIVENDFAFPTLVKHGETGFLCNNSAEMSQTATALANDEPTRYRIACQARQHIADTVGNAEKCWQSWKDILS